MEITLYPRYLIRSLFVHGRSSFFKAGYRLLYPEYSRHGMTPWQHYVLEGKRKGYDNGCHPSNSVFFREGYELEYPDVKASGDDPWRHFAETGSREGRDNGLHPDAGRFFAEGYLEMYPDVAQAGMDPWRHYVLEGKNEGRDNGLHPDDSLFFGPGYLAMYPDIKESGLDPWHHYVLSGKEEGRDNGLHPDAGRFFAEGYLEMYPDVAGLWMDPWRHYVLEGKNEGRDCGLHPDASRFFAEGYLEMYPDVAELGMDPWRHYVLEGKKEGRDNGLHPDVSRFFAEGYLDMNPDVARAGFEAWHHYVLHGKQEGRCNGLEIYPSETGMKEKVMKENPLVAIVMPTFNRKHTVMKAIASVQKQTWTNWHLYVVDDFSVDGTYEYLRSAITDPRIILLRSESKGQCGARNTALRQIKNEDYVAYLDSDNTWNCEYLELMLCRLLENKTCCCYAVQRLFQRNKDGSEEDTRFRYDSLDISRLRCSNFIDINVFMHRADLLKETGLFDESLHRVEDWDLILSFAERYSFSRLPYIACNYDDTKDDGRVTPAHGKVPECNIVRNKHWFDWKFIADSSSRKDQSLVSVIVYCGMHDSVSCLENCLRSLNNARLYGHSKYKTEIILVVGSSSKRAREILSVIRDQSLADRYLVNIIGDSFPLSCNMALSAAEGAYVVYLDLYSYISEHWLDALIDPLRRHPDLKGTCSRIMRTDGAIHSAGCLFDPVSGLPYDVLHEFPGNVPAAQKLTLLPCVNSYCCAFRCRDIAALKGLYSVFETSLAIADLCMQLSGGRPCFAYIPSSSVIYTDERSHTAGRISDFSYFEERWHGTEVYGDGNFYARRNLSSHAECREKVCSVTFKKYSRTACTRCSADYFVPVFELPERQGNAPL